MKTNFSIPLADDGESRLPTTASAIMRYMVTQSSNKPKLGILVCGHSPDKVVEQHGRYAGLFEKLLGPDVFDYLPFAVVDGEFPPSIHTADAWLITGSKHGVYDPLPWIAPLEEFIRDANAETVPMVGICFGHQIMAQALGGKAGKFDGGWIAGTREYQLSTETGIANAKLNAWHQDQVLALPANARALGSSQNCEYAAIAYGEHAVSLQPHPEFENNYVESLLETRGGVLPTESLQKAADSLGQNLNNKAIAAWLRSILFNSA